MADIELVFVITKSHKYNLSKRNVDVASTSLPSILKHSNKFPPERFKAENPSQKVIITLPKRVGLRENK